MNTDDQTTPSEYAFALAICSFFLSLLAALLIYHLPFMIWEKDISTLWVWSLTLAFATTYCGVGVLRLHRRFRHEPQRVARDKQMPLVVIYMITGLNTAVHVFFMSQDIATDAVYAVQFLPSIILTMFSICHLLIIKMAWGRMELPQLLTAGANTYTTVSGMIVISKLYFT